MYIDETVILQSSLFMKIPIFGRLWWHRRILNCESVVWNWLRISPLGRTMESSRLKRKSHKLSCLKIRPNQNQLLLTMTCSLWRIMMFRWLLFVIQKKNSNFVKLTKEVSMESPQTSQPSITTLRKAFARCCKNMGLSQSCCLPLLWAVSLWVCMRMAVRWDKHGGQSTFLFFPLCRFYLEYAPSNPQFVYPRLYRKSQCCCHIDDF